MGCSMKMMKTIPALPVEDVTTAAACYHNKFGFTVIYQDDGFAILSRDDIQIHLWGASDKSWRPRLRQILDGSLEIDPDTVSIVVSGAETFLAGTASCRVEVQSIDELYAEYQTSGV